MNIYLQTVPTIAVLLLGYKPFKYCRLQWKVAVSTIMYWSTEQGTHRLKYMTAHERKATMDAVDNASKAAKLYLIIITGIIALVVFGIYLIFNII